jgi:hypothetical protein
MVRHGWSAVLYWVIGLGVTAIVALLMWLAWLRFLRWLVKQCNNDSTVMRDAAVAARAFPGAGVAGAIARAFHRDPVAEVSEAVREVVQVREPEQPRPDSEPTSP